MSAVVPFYANVQPTDSLEYLLAGMVCYDEKTFSKLTAIPLSQIARSRGKARKNDPTLPSFVVYKHFNCEGDMREYLQQNEVGGTNPLPLGDFSEDVAYNRMRETVREFVRSAGKQQGANIVYVQTGAKPYLPETLVCR